MSRVCLQALALTFGFHCTVLGNTARYLLVDEACRNTQFGFSSAKSLYHCRDEIEGKICENIFH